MFPRQGKRAKHSHSSKPALTSSSNGHSPFFANSTSSGSTSLNAIPPNLPRPFSFYQTSSDVPNSTSPATSLSSSTTVTQPTQSTCDPVAYFPPELLLHLLLYLPFTSRLSSALVNSQWRHVATGFPELWRDIVLTEHQGSKKLLSMPSSSVSSSSSSSVPELNLKSMLSVCLKRSQTQLRSIALHCPKGMTDGVVTRLLAHVTKHRVPHWRKLSVQGAPKVSAGMLSTLFSTLGNLFAQKNRVCSSDDGKEESRRTEKYHGLTHVTFRQVPAFSGEHMEQLLTLFLLTLNYVDVSQCMQVEKFPSLLDGPSFLQLHTLVLAQTGLTDIGLIALVFKCPNLMHLDIERTPHVSINGFSTLLCLRLLRTLSFGPLKRDGITETPVTLDQVLRTWYVPMRTWRMHSEPLCHGDALVKVFEVSESSLTHVSLVGCANVGESSFEKLMFCTQLVSLDVSACPHLTDAVFISIVRLCDQLTTINISHLGPPNITEKSFQCLIHSVPKLHTLIARHFNSLTSASLMHFVIQHPTWRYLDISGCSYIFGDTLIQARAYLKQFRKSATLVYTSGNTEKRGRRIYA